MILDKSFGDNRTLELFLQKYIIGFEEWEKEKVLSSIFPCPLLDDGTDRRFFTKRG